jgi:hypothetical protein
MWFVGRTNVVTDKVWRRHIDSFEVGNPPWGQMKDGKDDYITKCLIEPEYLL